MRKIAKPEKREAEPATARAEKPKAQRGSTELANGKSAATIDDRIRALVRTRLSSKPLAKRNRKIRRQTVDRFLASRSALLLEDLYTFAQLLGTTPALLLAEARGNGAILAKVALHEQLIPALKLMQSRVEELRSGITPSPREDAMLEGDEEQDEATEMRALLECISRQHLAETIAAAQEMAGWRLPEGKNREEEE
jgi:hypothetical protein